MILPFLKPHHHALQKRFGWYHKWHQHPLHTHAHVGILGAYSAIVTKLVVGAVVIGVGLNSAFAATHSWDSQADWDTGVKNGVVTTSGGDVTLASHTSGALSFNGSNSIVTIPYTSSQAFTDNLFTAEAWIRIPATTPSYSSIVKQSDDSNNEGYNLGIDASNHLRLDIGKSGTSYTAVAGTTNLEDNKWHHVAGTYDGANLKVWVDGVVEGTQARATEMRIPSGVSVGFGNDTCCGGRYLNGQIDEVRISNAVRYTSSFSPAMTFDSDANTTGLYHLDEGSGQTVTDASSHSDGTLGANSSVGSDDPIRIQRTGEPGALSFDGSNDVVSIPDSASLRPASAVTAEGWFKFNDTRDQNLVSKEANNSAYDAYTIWYQSGNLNAGVGGGTSTWDSTSVGWTPTVGQWYHIAMTFDDAANSLALWIDGTMVASKSTGVSMVHDNHTVDIGKEDEGGGNYQLPFYGSIDSVRISDTALYTTSFTPAYAFTSDSHTMGLWNFNEGSGQTVTDSSSNHNDGTLGLSSSSGSDDPTWQAATVLYQSPGTITTQYDAGSTKTFREVNWTGTVPAGASIQARIRTAATQGGLASATWSDYASASPLSASSVPNGQWAEVEYKLAAGNGAAPVLSKADLVYVDPVSSNSHTWTTQSDWNSGANSHVDTASSSGDVKLDKVNSASSLKFSTGDLVTSSNVAMTATDNFTVEAWINPSTLSQAANYIVGNTDLNSNGYSIAMNSGNGGAGSRLVAHYYGVNWEDSGYNFPEANRWYHVALVRSGGTTKFFVDGVQTPSTGGDTPRTPNSGMSLGNTTFQGSIDGVRISNVARYSSTFTPSHAYTPDANTKLQWNLDEGAGQVSVDASGNGNLATLGNNSSVESADPEWQGSSFLPETGVSFDGSDDFASKAATTSLHPSTGTLEGWVNVRASQTTDARIWELGDASTDVVNVHIDDTGHAVASGTKASSEIFNLRSDAAINDNNWHHVAVTWSASGAFIYVDGSLTDFVSGDMTLSLPSASDFNMGRQADGSHFFNGLIKQTRISTSVRYASSFTPAISFTTDGSTAGLWALNETSGQAFADSSANGNNLILGASSSVGSDDPAWKDDRTYYPSGSVVLNYDVGSDKQFTNLSWNGSVPGGTGLALRARSSSTVEGLDSATWTSSATSSPLDLGGLPLSRYVQVEVTLTGSGRVTPTLSDLTVNYQEQPGSIPDSPTNTTPSTASRTNDTTPTLTSSAFSDPDGGDTHLASQWQVRSSAGSYTSPVIDSGQTTSALTSYTPTTALTDGTYYWHVRYKDSDGNWSAYSAETSFTLDTVAPGKLTNITVTNADGSVTLNWTRPADADYNGVAIYRSTTLGTKGSLLTTKNGSATSHTDSTVTNNTAYYYAFETIDDVGNQASSNGIGGVYTSDANTKLLWHLDEATATNPVDSSSNGWAGDSTGTSVVDAKFGKGRSITNGYVRTTNQSPDQYYDSGTIEFSYKPSGDLRSGNWGLFGTHDSCTGANIKVSSGTLYYGADCHGYGSYAIPSDWTGIWKHIAMTWTNSGSKLYIDNVQVSTASINSQGYDLGSDMRVGYSLWNGYYANGIYDEVRVSTVARTSFNGLAQTFALPSDATVTVTSPNGGETVNGEATQNITWSTTGTGISAVNLDYSLDGGTSWTSIATGEADDGTYAWGAPEIARNTTTLVRVTILTSGGFSLGSDVSDANFLLDTDPPDSVSQVTMNTGDTTALLRWVTPNDSDIASYKIYRSTTSGVLGSLVKTISDASINFWQDTGLTTGTPYYYSIITTDLAGNTSASLGLKGKYYADTGMTLFKGVRTDSTLNFGTWSTGNIPGFMSNQITNIGAKWEGLLRSEVDDQINFSLVADDTATLWIDGVQIATRATAGTANGSATLAKGLHSIKVVHTGASGANGVSLSWSTASGSLSSGTIGASYLNGQISGTPHTSTAQLTAPNGGQKLGSGATQNITWTTSGTPTAANVWLYYSLNDGANYTLISAREADDGSYSWTVPGATSTAVRVKVESRTADGEVLASDVSDEAFTIDAMAPAAPTNIVLTPSTSGSAQVVINWTNPTELDYAKMRIFRSTSSGTLGSQITEVTAPTATYTDTDVSYGTQYYYTLRSVDDAGNSISSFVGGTGLVGKYYSGSNLGTLIGTQTDPNIDFDWGSGAPSSPPGVGSDNFSIRWDGYIKIDTTENVSFNPTYDDYFRIWVDDVLVGCNWSTGCDTSTNPINLTAGIHKIRVDFGENGGSANIRLYYASTSITNQIIPASKFSSAWVQSTSAQYSARPNNASVTVTSPNGAEKWQGGSNHAVTWTNGGDGATTVRLYYSTNDGGSYPTTIATPAATDETYTWTLPKLDTTHLRVKAEQRNSIGDVLASDTSNASFAIDSTAPSAPTSISAARGNTEATLSWVNTTASDKAGVHIYRDTTANSETPTLIQTITNPSTVSYTDTGLTNGTPYYYSVKSYDDVGNESIAANSSVDANTLAMWSFNESSGTTASDATGNFPGTLNGSPVWVAGKYGNGLQFNGGNYVSVPSFTLGSTFTIEAWVKSTSTGLRAITRMDANDTIALYQWTDGKFSFYGPGGLDLHSTTSIVADTWYHVAGTFDGGQAKIYVNGVLENSTTVSNISIGTSTLKIGGDNFSQMWAGSIDEMRISNTARTTFNLTPSEELSVTPGTNVAPDAPTVASPANHTHSETATPTFTLNAFSDPDGGDTHAATQWQVSASNDFNIKEISTGDDATNLLTYTTATLAEGRHYFRARFKDSDGNYSAWSIPQTYWVDTTAPAGPTNITATGSTNGPLKIDLSWTNPTDSDFDGVKIYRSTSAGTQGSLLQTMSAGDTSYSDSTVSLGTTYYYALTSTDTLGHESPATQVGGPYSSDGNTSILWHLDEGSAVAPVDSSSNAYSGESGGNTVVAGKFGNARSLSSGYLRAPSYPAGWKTAGTVEFYYKPTGDLRSGNWGLFGTSDTCSGFIMQATGGNLRFGSGCYGFASYAIPSDWTNTWKHFAVTWNNDKTKLYIDNVLVGTYDAGNNDSYYFTSDVRLGYDFYYGYANGVYDEFRFSTTARTDFTALGQTPAVATDALPDNPLGVAAKTSGATSITLNWTSNPTAPDFDAINIYRSTASGTLGSLVHTTDNTEESAKSWTDTGLSSSTAYYYTLKGVDTQGNEGAGLAADANTVGLWNFNEGTGQVINDISSSANNGTLGANSSASSDDPDWVIGKYGNGLSFNGSSDYALVPDSGPLRLGSTGTVEAWVKMDGLTSSNQRIIVAKADSTGAMSYSLYANPDGSLAFFVDSDGSWGPSCAVGSSVLTAGAWYHIAGTYDGTTIKFYLNGTLVSSAACTATPISNATGLRIGGGVGGFAYFNGQIDGVKISNVVRTSFVLTDFIQVSAITNDATVSLTAPVGGETYKGADSEDITWSASGTDIDKMALFYSTNSGSSYANTVATGEDNDGTYSWTVPSINTANARVKIEARDSSGNVLQYDFSDANFTIDSTAPAAVTGLTADGGDGEVVLNWVNPTDPDFASVTIYRSTTAGSQGSSIVTLSGGEETYTDTGRTDGTLYYYSIETTDTVGNVHPAATVGGPYVSDGGSHTKLLWHFDEAGASNAADASGNNITATESGNTVVAGKFGNARSTTGGYVYTNSYPASGWASAGSIEFWYKPTSDVRSGNYGLFTTGSSCTGMMIQITGGNLRIGSQCYGQADYVIPDNWAGIWKHIAVTWDSDKTKLYVDNALVGTYDAGNSDTYALSTNLYALTDNYYGSAQGTMDEVRVSDIARTDFTAVSQITGLPQNATATLTAANGGETWNAETTRNITWSTTGSGIATISLAYSVDGGINWNSIATGETDDGSYTWTLPKILRTTNAKIRVQALHASGAVMASDVSDAAFTLDGDKPDQITNIATSVGANNVNLTWTNPSSADVDHIEIYRSTTAGSLGSAIESDLDPNSTFYSDTTTSSGTTYYYSLFMVDAAGNKSNADPQKVDSNTLLLYKFDEGSGQVVVDSSGNAVNGTRGFDSAPSGDDPSWTPNGRNNGALSFDGVDDFVNVASPPTLANASFTLEAWAKRTSIGTSDYIIGQGTAGTNTGLHFGFSSNNYFYCNFYGNDLASPEAYTDTAWHYWACSYDSVTNSRKLYKDGVLISSNTAAADYQGTGPLTIGGLPFSSAGNYFGGIIDQVTISGVVREPSAFNYSDQSAGTPNATSISVTSPNGGEKWKGGATQNITWNSSGTPAATSLKLYYSTDGGVTYPNVIATGETDDGTYAWTVPNVDSSTLRVKIEARNGTGSFLTSDVSDGIFAVDVNAPAPVEPVIVTPATSGTASVAISWTNPTDSDFAGVKIYRSTTSGTKGSLVYTTSVPTETSWSDTGVSWGTTYYYSLESFDDVGNQRAASRTGGPYTTDANTRLLWHFNESSGSPVDSSGNNTSYNPCGTPPTFVSGKYGNGFRVTPSNCFYGSVSPSGTTWNNGTVEFWYKPNTDVRTGNYGLYTSYDSSSGGINIAISGGNLQVRNLSGDNLIGNYAIASNWANVWHHIGATWDNDKTRLYVDNVLVGTYDLADNYYFGGQSYFGATPFSGWYADGTFDEFRISNITRTDLGVSLQQPAVLNNSSLTVTAPNGAEYYKGGSAHNITWGTTGEGIDSIRLYYSSDGGSTFPTTIATGEADDGTYSWSVPTTDTSTAKIKVEARNAQGDVLTSDVSNANFAIDSTSPAMPTGVTATASTNGAPQTVLAWTNPAGSDFAGMNIYRSTTAGQPGSLVHTTGPTDTSWTDTSISLSTYYYAFEPFDAAGNTSAVSSVGGPYANDADTQLLLHMNESSGTTVSDSSSNTLSATRYNGSNTTGKYGNGITTAGSSYIYVNDYPNAYDYHNVGSVEFWYKPSVDLRSATRGLFSTGDTCEGLNIGTDSSGSLLVGSECYGFSNYTIPADWTNTWKHFAVTWNGDKTKLYIDNVLVGTYDLGNNDTYYFYDTVQFGYSGTFGYGNGIYDEARISTIERTDFSALSTQYSATPSDAKPGAVTALTATPGDTIMDLAWTAPAEPDIAGYNIYRSTTQGTVGSKLNGGTLVSPTSYHDTGLTNGTPYYYTVKAVDNAAQESDGASKLWTSQSDWETWTRTYTSATATPGSLKLVGLGGSSVISTAATASGSSTPNSVANINDGDINTWTAGEHASSNPYILTWDSPQSVNKIRLYGPGACYYGAPQNVSLSYWDGAAWVTPSEWTNKPTGWSDPCSSSGWTDYYSLPQAVVTTKVRAYYTSSYYGGFDLGEFEVVGGSSFVPSGTATYAYTPEAGVDQNWATATFNKTTPTDTTATAEYSHDGSTWTSDISTVIPSETLYIRITLATTSSSVSSTVEDLKVTSFQQAVGTPFQANSPPATPTASSPANGYRTTDTTPTLTITGYSDPDSDTQTATQWVIDNNINFSSPEVVTGDDASNLLSFTPGSGLADDTYYWKARFKDAVGNYSAYSTSRSFTVDTTAPGAPSSVAADAGDGKVDLSWTNPGASDFQHVNIYRSTDGGLGSKIGESVDASATSYSDSTAVNSTLYYYTLKAVDDLGNESTASSQVSATPLEVVVTVTAPNGGQLWAGGSHHDITWTSGGNGIDSARLYYSTNGSTYTSIGTDSGNTGTFDWTVASLNSSTVTVKVELRDSLGDVMVSDVSNANFTVDSTAPSAPVVSTPSTTVTLNAASYDVTGTAEANSLVTVYKGGVSQGTQQLTGGATSYSVTVTLAQDADSTFVVKATDAAGNQSSGTTAPTITEDSTAPSAPVVSDPASVIRLNANTYSIAGTAEANSLVRVYTDPNNDGSQADGASAGSQQLTGGSTSYSISVSLSQDAANNFVVTSKDVALNESSAADVPTITEDSTAPSAPTVVTPSTAVTLNADTYDVTGTAEANSLVTVYKGGVSQGSQQLTGGATSYSVTVTLAQDAASTFVVKAKDVALNESSGTTAPTITEDSTAPSAPVITAPATAIRINADTYDVTGTAEANSLVTVYKGGVSQGSQQLTGGSTSYSITVNLAQDATNVFTVKATDAASNQSSAATASTITEDSTAPSAPTVSSPSTATTVNADTFDITGSAEANALVTIYTDPNNDGSQADGSVAGTQQLTGGSTSYSITVNLAQDADNNFIVTAKDSTDNMSSATNVPTITEDSTAPAGPLVTAPATAIRINADTYDIAGTAEADSLVKVYTDPNHDGSQADGSLAGSQQLTGGGTAYSITVTLSQDAANYFVVTASDAYANQSLSTLAPTITEDSTAPSAPTSFSATAGNSSVTLNWTNPVDTLAHVNVYRSTSSGVLGSKIGESVNGMATTYTDGTPSNGTTYYYTVKAVDIALNESSASTQAAATPNNVSLGVTSPNGGEHWAGGSHQNITWTSSGSGIDSVTLLYSTDGGSSYPNTIDSSLADSHTYDWTVPSLNNSSIKVKVEAHDVLGNVLNADTSNASFTIDSINPTFSSISTSSNNTDTTIARSGSLVTTTFSVSEALGSNPTVTIGGQAMACALGTCADGDPLSYTYQRTLTGDETEGSAVISITGSDPSANSGSNTATTFTTDFTAPSAPVVSTPATTVTVNADTYDVTGTAEANSLVTVYKGGVSQGSQQLTGGSTGYSISVSLTQNATSTFTVKASDRAGNQSSAATAPTITEDSTAPAGPVVTTPATAFSLNADTFDITGSTEANALVTVYTDPNHDGSQADGVSAGSQQLTGGATLYSITVNLTQDAVNYFVVTATDAYSNESLATVVPALTEDSTAPAAPSGVSAEAGDTTAIIRWTNPTGDVLAHTNVYRSTSSGVLGSKIGETVNEFVTSYSDTGRTNGTTYYYTVKAEDAASNISTASTQVAVTPNDVVLGVTSPLGGEDWAGGSVHDLTWTTSGSGVNLVNLYYSTNGGSSYTGTVALGVANTGTRSWTLPSIDSASMRVKVEAMDILGNVLTSATSGSNFSIDSTLPAISSLAVASNNTDQTIGKLGNTVSLTFTSSENLVANPTVTLGGKPMAFSSVSGHSYTYTRVLDSSDAEGLATISIDSIDLAGNQGNDSSAHFMIDFSVPVPTPTPAPVSEEPVATTSGGTSTPSSTPSSAQGSTSKPATSASPKTSSSSTPSATSSPEPTAEATPTVTPLASIAPTTGPKVTPRPTPIQTVATPTPQPESNLEKALDAMQKTQNQAAAAGTVVVLFGIIKLLISRKII